jgi:hypothetical protein
MASHPQPYCASSAFVESEDVQVSQGEEGRQFMRHPVAVPIEAIPTEADDRAVRCHAYSLGVGGVAFRFDQMIEPGTLLQIRIPFVFPQFETDARVVWCRCHENIIDLGVEFLNSDDAFRARMVEQVCHIESYRRDVYEREGRQLTPEEASLEWIEKFAAEFP